MIRLFFLLTLSLPMTLWKSILALLYRRATTLESLPTVKEKSNKFEGKEPNQGGGVEFIHSLENREQKTDRKFFYLSLLFSVICFLSSESQSLLEYTTLVNFPSPKSTLILLRPAVFRRDFGEISRLSRLNYLS